jgi:hypothetical protein
MLAFLLVLLCAPQINPHRARPQPAADAGIITPAALSPEQIDERIRMYLGTIEKPITPAMWQRLGPAAIPQLEKIARDPEQLPTTRAMAIDGIAAIGSLTAPDLLLDLAKDEKQPTVVRLAAIGGAGRVLPKDRVPAELQRVMETATNPNVRKVAAEVLATHGGCAAVRAQAKREQHKDRMAKALKACSQKQ